MGLALWTFIVSRPGQADLEYGMTERSRPSEKSRRGSHPIAVLTWM